MANKKQEEKRQERIRKEKEKRQEYERMEKEKKFNAVCKKLRYFPLIAIALLVVAIILFSVTWAEIYNSDIDGAEVSINGWNCFISAITDNYTSADATLGDMAVPFYYYAADYCEQLSIFTVVSFFLILVTIIVQVVIIITKAHMLNYLLAVLDTISAVFVFVCLGVALSMNNSQILPIYCSGNPACSITSLAVLPAVAVLGALTINVLTAVKYTIEKKMTA